MNGSPIIYPDITSLTGHDISIRNRFEICQGGPEVGELYIDEQFCFKSDFFGGPMYVFENALYLPMRRRTLFFNGFELVCINLTTKKLSKLKIKDEIIWIDMIDEAGIYYFNSVADDKKMIFIPFYR